MKTVIIGNGPAAVSAVEAIRSVDGTSGITMISRESWPAYTPCFLSRYLAGEIGKKGLFMRDDDFYEKNDVRTIFGVSVTEVRDDENEVVLADGTKLSYDALLIAAGSNPNIPKLPGIEGEGVFFFKTLADADMINAGLGKNKKAVVVGAGFIAIEIAEALHTKGMDVTIIGRRNGILLRMLDEEVAGLVARHIESRGVRLIGGRTLASVRRGRENRLEGVVLDNGDAVACDMLVIASGVSPNLEMVKNTSIRTGRGILVDGQMRTSVSNVYAAGDIAEVEIGGTRKINPIHPNAVKGGWIAGCNIAGQAKAIDIHLEDMNVLTFFGLSVLSIGVQKGAEVFRRSSSAEVVKAYAGEDGLLQGIQLVGNVAKGGLYLSIMRRGIPINKGFDILNPRINYGYTCKNL